MNVEVDSIRVNMSFGLERTWPRGMIQGLPRRTEGRGAFLAKNGVCYNPYAQREEIPVKAGDTLN